MEVVGNPPPSQLQAFNNREREGRRERRLEGRGKGIEWGEKRRDRGREREGQI